MDFRNVIYGDVEKITKNKNSSQETYLDIRVTDILKFYEVYFVHIVNVCFAFKNSHYAYIPTYMDKTLPILGNEKEQ